MTVTTTKSAQAAGAADPLASRRAMGPAFRSLPREHGFEPLRVEGTLPPELRGTLYRNGPSQFEAQGTPYRHWLDGDGGITAVRLDGTSARGAARITRTAELAEERASGKMLYSSGFTLGPIWRKRLFGAAKNPCNIHVLVWQGRLFALSDAGMPYELDPTTLETKGAWRLDGVARQVVNAHVRVHPTRAEVFAFGASIGMRSSLDVYSLPARGAPRLLAAIPTARPPLLAHDLVMSERHLIFVLPPVRVAIMPIMLGTGSPMDAITWHEEDGCEIVVVPIDAPAELVRFRVPAFFHFHYANAFETAPGKIAIDLGRYGGFDLGAHFMLDALRSGDAWAHVPVARLDRMHLDLTAKSARWETLWDANADFMQTHPARQGLRHRFVWSLVARDHVDRIEKLDLETGEVRKSALRASEYPGEPTFVPRPGASDEDDGWVLTIAYDAATDTSGLVVMDARDPEVVIARASFDHHVPFPLHGTWAAG